MNNEPNVTSVIIHTLSLNKTLYKKNITEYHLIFKEGFSANTIYRIKKGEAMSTKTLDALCYALDCNVEDIIKFIKE